MAARVNQTERIRLYNVAENEIKKYAYDHALWHKHIHNVDLDSMQVLKCLEMDQHKNTIDYSCRRTRKTSIKELYLLKHLACNADQEEGIVSPREAQSITNLKYHLDAIERSPVLTNYIAYNRGRRQLADTYYTFANRSSARAYGIMSQVDGGDLTCASLEEVDDMPHDRLTGNFLPMLAATDRLGADKSSINEPEIRITGVFKGADTLSSLISSGGYFVLPAVNVHLGIQLGIINKQFAETMQRQLSPEEYIRQFLCKNISSRNLIWELWVRKALQRGLSARIEFAPPLPGLTYKKRGLIGLGYDHTGHGENSTSSKSAVVIVEQIGNFCCFIFAKSWPPGTDEQIIRADILSFWRYFRPDYAMGDAFGIGLMTNVNDDLFTEHLTTVDRRSIDGGNSTSSSWNEWPFAPLRFEGMIKHIMAQALRSIFNNGQAVIPYFDHDDDLIDPELEDLRALVLQLTNIKQEETSKSYSSYKQVNTKVGDDIFDAAMAAIWALVSKGAAPVQTSIEVARSSRDKLLGLSTVWEGRK